MLGTAGRVTTWAGFKFNPRRCATLNIDSERRETLPTQFQIQKGIPPALSEMEVYENLRIQTGYQVAQSANKAPKDKLQTKNDK
jgi:hypothetical protein